MFSIARHAWLAPAMLSVGCADRQLPQWPTEASLEAVEVTDTIVSLQWLAATDNRALLRYHLSQDGQTVAEIPAEGEPALTVASLAEFTKYTFDIVAEDEAGNVSPPLSLAVRTADVTPPVWPAGCELTAALADPGDIDSGLVLTWCEATDNDRLDHFELRHSIAGPTSLPPDQLTSIRTEQPIDGTYTVSACDPSGNCAELKSEYVGLLRTARMEAMRDQIMETSSLLALLSAESSLGSLSESALFWDDSALGGMDFSGFEGVGIAREAEGLGWLGGMGTRGATTSRGGGGGVVGVGELGTRGSSTYRAPAASLKPGGQADLAAHVSLRLSRIEHCYSQARSESPGLKGSLTIRLAADAEGSVTVDGVSGPGDGGLTSCVTGALRGRLAESPGEAVTGTFTVTLDPGAA